MCDKKIIFKILFFCEALLLLNVQVYAQEESSETVNIFEILRNAVTGARTLAQTVGRSASGLVRRPKPKSIPCYDSLGCFPIESPWTHSILRPVPPPDDPINIKTTFNISNSLTNIEVVSWPDLAGLDQIKFGNKDKKAMVYVIVHGFSSGADAKWMQEMKKKLENLGGQVILVDWSSGANVQYFQAISNARIVGAEISRLLKELSRRFGVSMNQVHIIGHSLGAHAAGYAGKIMADNKIYRITGLDPAQPGFEGLENDVHLWKTDALFVDIIHTSARPFIPLFGFGMLKPIGHLDFYINGGAVQPQCLNIEQKTKNIRNINSLSDLVNKSKDFILGLIPCSHSLAVTYWIESLDSKCIMWGKRPLQSVEQSITNPSSSLNFLQALVPNDWLSCTEEVCAPLGLKAFSTKARGALYVTTKAKPPFCISDRKTMTNLGKFLN